MITINVESAAVGQLISLCIVLEEKALVVIVEYLVAISVKRSLVAKSSGNLFPLLSMWLVITVSSRDIV